MNSLEGIPLGFKQGHQLFSISFWEEQKTTKAKMPFAEGTAPNCCGFCFCCRSKEPGKPSREKLKSLKEKIPFEEHNKLVPFFLKEDPLKKHEQSHKMSI